MKKNIIKLSVLILLSLNYIVQASSNYRYLHPITSPKNATRMIITDQDDLSSSESDNDSWKPWNSPVSFDYNVVTKDTQQDRQEVVADDAMNNDNAYEDDMYFEKEFKQYMLKKFANNGQDLMKLSLPPDSKFDSIKLQALMSEIEVRYAIQANIEIMNVSKINRNVTKDWLLLHFQMMLFQLLTPDFLENIHLFHHCQMQRSFINDQTLMNKIMFPAPHILMNMFLFYYNNHQDEQEQLRQDFLPLFQEINEEALKQSERLRKDGHSDKYVRVYRKPKFQNLLYTMKLHEGDHDDIDIEKSENIFW